MHSPACLAVAILALAACAPDISPKRSASVSPERILAERSARFSAEHGVGLSEERLSALRSQCSSSPSMDAEWANQHDGYDDCVSQAISGACAASTGTWGDYADCVAASGGNQIGEWR